MKNSTIISKPLKENSVHISHESNLGLIDGNDVFYDWATDAIGVVLLFISLYSSIGVG